MSDNPSMRMKRRLNLWLNIPILALIIYLVAQIINVAIKDGEKWQELANSQQLKSTVVSASRGTIYDSNAQVLAQSATVYTVYCDPVMLEEYLGKKDDKIKELEDGLAGNDDADKKASYQKQLDALLNSDDSLEELVTFLADVLQIETTTVRDSLTNTDSRYEIIKKNVEKTTSDKIEDKLTELELDGVRCDPTTKRFYPQNELAGSVLGHLNYDGDGIYGLEAYYDDYLSGVDGRIVTATNRDGTEIPYRYKQSYDAQNGDSLYLNIDSTIQLYLENALDEAVAEFAPKERACGIIMNPSTGQIYAMATVNGYDPNEPSQIYDESVATELAAMDEDSEEYTQARLEAWSTQWTNKAISELYFPGSVFKVVTGSSALEEKAISLSDTFDCGQVMNVEGVPIHCWASYSHGSQTLAQAIINSCNPAFIRIGQKLGAEQFCNYFKAYGLTETTGIDLPNEAQSIYCSYENMTLVDLATSSFGQTNKITPIQMITAYSAVINGGYLVTPQVVDKIVDSNGNVVKDFDTVIKRQVISEEVSAEMRDILENNVSTSHTGNCYIQGYKIGGKSGTSQKIDVDPTGNTYVGSYCAFAPADDPEVIMLVMVDDPTGDKYYGSQIATPVCVKVMSQVLPYLGIFPEYTDEELETLQVSVPNEQYESLDEAKETLTSIGLACKIVGTGDTVVKQVPSSGSLTKGGTVVLYTEDGADEETATVPNLAGLTQTQAIAAVDAVNLNISISGTEAYSDTATAQADQNVAVGSQVPIGTVISVTFGTSTVNSQ